MEERGLRCVTKLSGLPRRYAPRNDGVFSFYAKLLTPSLRGGGNPKSLAMQQSQKRAKIGPKSKINRTYAVMGLIS